MSSCGTVRLIPGPRGQNGADGADGAAGVSAFTTLGAQFIMPAELATAVATVVDSSWMTTGMYVYLQGAGWLQVTAIADATHATLMNLEDTATGAYSANVAPATVIALGNKIVATGPQGPAGTAGSSGAATTTSFLTKTNHVGTLPNSIPMSGLGTGLMFNTTGTGVTSIVTQGVANGNIAPVNDAGGLTNGEAVFATASGLESQSASTARTSLGLGTISTQAASNVAISGGTITGTTIAGSTGSFTTLAASGATSFSGATQFSSTVAFIPTGLQTLAAANTVSHAAVRARVEGSGGPVTLTSTPSVTLPVGDGHILLIQGTSDVNTLTLQDKATLPGTALNLGAATRVLGAGDLLFLVYDAATVEWYEISYSNV